MSTHTKLLIQSPSSQYRDPLCENPVGQDREHLIPSYAALQLCKFRMDVQGALEFSSTQLGTGMTALHFFPQPSIERGMVTLLLIVKSQGILPPGF